MTGQQLASLQRLHQLFTALLDSAKNQESLLPAVQAIRSLTHELCRALGEEPLPFAGEVTADMSRWQRRELHRRLLRGDAVNEIAGEGEHAHEVPTADQLAVHVVDSNGYACLVTWVASEDRYLFVDQDATSPMSASWRERCFLVQLPPSSDEHWADEVDWQQYLPEHSHSATDFDAPHGLVLVGCRADQEPDERLGRVLWDSHGGEE